MYDFFFFFFKEFFKELFAKSIVALLLIYSLRYIYYRLLVLITVYM